MKIQKIVFIFILSILIASPLVSAFERTDSMTRIEAHREIAKAAGLSYYIQSLLGTFSVYGVERKCTDGPITWDNQIPLKDGDTTPQCKGLLQIYGPDGSPLIEVGRKPEDIQGSYYPGDYYVTWTAPLDGKNYWWECYGCPYPPCRTNTECVTFFAGDTCNTAYGSCSGTFITDECTTGTECCLDKSSRCGEGVLSSDEIFTGTRKCSTDSKVILGEILDYNCLSSKCVSEITGWEVYEDCSAKGKVCTGGTNPYCTEGEVTTTPEVEDEEPVTPTVCVAENLIVESKDDNFKITSIESPSSASKDSSINVKVNLNNPSSDGAMFLECGIYPESTLKLWGTFSLASLLDAPNCIEYEENVDTKQVKLCAGQSTEVSLTMKAKKYSEEQYYVFCDTYERCRKSEADTGSSSSDYKSITLTGTSDDPTCTDGHINQDESDTDCGGTICDECPLAYRCKSNNDCESGFCNSEGYCDKRDLEKCSLPLDLSCNLIYDIPGTTDDSQPSNTCESGWCQDVAAIGFGSGDQGKCAEPPSGRKGHSDCVEGGFDLSSLSDKVLGVPIFGWIIIGVLLLLIMSKGRSK